MQPLSAHGRGGSAVRQPRNVLVQAQSVVGISRMVSDLSRAESFYCSAPDSNCTSASSCSRLFICASHALYAIYTNQRGAARP